jgi:transposase
MLAISKSPDRVVIAIDPHKASWTAAAVDASSQPVATIRVPVSRDGYRALRRFACRWPDPTWAIEGASGLGAPLTARLRADGIDVVDVPAKLAARVRMLSTGHGRKNDDADAVSVGIAALSARTLNSAAVEGTVTALRAIVDHRDDLVKTRTQTVNRLHVVLTNLIPGRVGTIDRFRSAAAFATYTGTAPIDVSSGDVVRHRLSRAGDRQLNLCLHVMALTQIRQDTPGRAYYLRKRTDGKGRKEAMRCLKRRLSDVVYRQLRRDANRLEASPGGHSGAALLSGAASSNPAR